MIKKIADELVTALRSGKYKQSTGKLRTEFESLPSDHPAQGYCCLGVLCDIASSKGVCHWIQMGDYVNPAIGEYYCAPLDINHLESKRASDWSSGYLPPVVQVWANVKTKNGKFKVQENHHRSLADLNDAGCSFEEIADIIEKNWEKL